MPVWLSGFVTATPTTPAVWGPVTEVIVPELTTTTLVAAVPPRAPAAPDWKFVPAIVTGVPPAVGPAPGLMPATVTPEPKSAIVRIPDALVVAWPSGFVTVMVRDPVAAPAPTVRFRVICVGFVYVTPLTVTPPPFTTAASRLGNEEPGSKNPEPPAAVPVRTTLPIAPCA